MPKSRPFPEDAPLTRRTITIHPEIETEILTRFGAGKFSAFAQRAFSHELQRERIAEWLEELEAARGGKPLPSDAVAFAEAAWQKRKRK